MIHAIGFEVLSKEMRDMTFFKINLSKVAHKHMHAYTNPNSNKYG
jgi:hypothetical protein